MLFILTSIYHMYLFFYAVLVLLACFLTAQQNTLAMLLRM